MRKKVKVATLCENGQGARTAKPHGHKTDVSHGHDVGQIEVGECLSASSEPQKDWDAYRQVHFGIEYQKQG